MKIKCPKLLINVGRSFRNIGAYICDIFFIAVHGIIDLFKLFFKHFWQNLVFLIVLLPIPIACYVKSHEEELGLEAPPERVTVVEKNVTPGSDSNDYHTTVFVKWLDGNVQKLEVKHVKPFACGNVYEITTESDDRLYFSVDNVVVLERKRKNGGTIAAPSDHRPDRLR